MDGQKLYREQALEKVSSPEQLNEYIKVAGAGVWVMLGGLMAVFAAFFVWGFFGSIPETTSLTGTALIPAGQTFAVFCYLPIDQTKQLSVGMEARISPDYAPKEQFGYIRARVGSIGASPVTATHLRGKLGDDFALLSIPPGNVIEVIVEPTRENGALQWSSVKGASVDVTVGSTCLVSIVTRERKPYELFFK